MVSHDSAKQQGARATPRVSVVMSVYNSSRYLESAIDSILGQTYDDFEFLVINDGSTDDTQKILASYDDPRIVVLDNKRNLGLAASLNRGVSIARGEYIARQDADDVSYPQRLTNQVAYLDAHPQVGVVGTTTEWIDDDNNVVRVWRQPTGNPAIHETLLKHCCLIHGSTMFRRRCFEEMGGYNSAMRTGQDYDLWLRMSDSWDMGCLAEVLYKYRWHPGMISTTRQKEQERNAEIALDRAIRRRLRYGALAVRGGSDDIPERLRNLSRRRLAERYVWWSAGARKSGRRLALRFIIVALLLDPTTPQIWRYVAGIANRKLHRLCKRSG